MNNASETEQIQTDPLTDGELALVAGGAEDPIKSIKGMGEN